MIPLKVMNAEYDQLLKYTIDTLLKSFNPQRRPIMKKLHFFKMMDILDTRLQKQDIDINYPKYWYRYGSIAHIGVLDQRVDGFSRYLNGDNILYPHPPRNVHDIDDNLKIKIDSTINSICKQYQYKPEYGKLLKKDSYDLNSPYKFNTIFQDFLDLVESLKYTKQSSIFSVENNVENKFEGVLNTLLAIFPEEDYPELVDIHLVWDDTTRLVIKRIKEQKLRYELLSNLVEMFWTTYSNAVRIDYNQHISKGIIANWEQQYSFSVTPTLKELEDFYEKIIMSYKFDVEADDELVKEILQKAYELSY